MSNKIKIALVLTLILIGILVFILVHFGNFTYSYPDLIRIEQHSSGKNKSVILYDLKLAKAYNPASSKMMPKFIPVGKIKGLKGRIKVVFGVSGGDINNMLETLGNIFYIMQYAKHNRLKYKIAVVVYGKMAGHLINTTNPLLFLNKRLIEKMRAESNQGVKFYVCYNALMINHLVRSVIPKFVKPVPMGLLQIYAMRKKGYMYFTNP